nr:uncharacterized protein LOC121822018 isoform X2 [Peromyscus maniculatus bairdii]
MPGNDVRRSHSSVRPTTQPNGAHIHRSRLSKCQHQRWAKLETHQASGGFAIHIFPRALSGTWQQVTWQPLTSKTASGIISGSTWIVSQPAASLLPPPHPTSSLPNPKSGKTNSGLRATLLLGVPWWPRPEQHARARSSAAIPAGLLKISTLPDQLPRQQPPSSSYTQENASGSVFRPSDPRRHCPTPSAGQEWRPTVVGCC